MPINYYCDVEVQSNVLTTDVSNSRVGINEASPAETLHVNGAIRTGAASGATYVKLSNDDINLYNTGSLRGSVTLYPNSSSGSLYIYGANGSTVYFGAPSSYTTNIDVQGTGRFQTIANATSDTDKFLVSDGGTIKYRTGAEVRSDIGAGTGDGTVTGTGSSARVAFWNGASNITSDSEFYWNSTNNYLGIGAGSSPQSPLHVKSTTVDNIVRIVGASGGKPQINIYEGTNNVGRITCTGAGSFDFSNLISGDINFFTGGSTSMTIASNGTVNIAGGSLTLDGTGRIQGVDTVSAGTDAANKTYVDNAVSGSPQGTVTSVATGDGLTGGTITGSGTISVDYGINGIMSDIYEYNIDNFNVSKLINLIQKFYNSTLSDNEKLQIVDEAELEIDFDCLNSKKDILKITNQCFIEELEFKNGVYILRLGS